MVRLVIALLAFTIISAGTLRADAPPEPKGYNVRNDAVSEADTIFVGNVTSTAGEEAFRHSRLPDTPGGTLYSVNARVQSVFRGHLELQRSVCFLVDSFILKKLLATGGSYIFLCTRKAHSDQFDLLRLALANSENIAMVKKLIQTEQVSKQTSP
jgi:hypothetical protein